MLDDPPGWKLPWTGRFRTLPVSPDVLGKSFHVFVLCLTWVPSYTPTTAAAITPLTHQPLPPAGHTALRSYAHPVVSAPGSCDPTHSYRGYRYCHENQVWSESLQVPGDGDRSGTGRVDSPLKTLRPDPGTEGVFHLWLQRGEVSLGMLMALLTITARDPD